MNSAGAKYAKYYNVPAVFTDSGASVTLFGDVDGNGKIDSTDARRALRIAATIERPMSDYQIFLADLNANGTIDTGDAQLILRKAAGLI